MSASGVRCRPARVATRDRAPRAVVLLKWLRCSGSFTRQQLPPPRRRRTRALSLSHRLFSGRRTRSRSLGGRRGSLVALLCCLPRVALGRFRKERLSVEVKPRLSVEVDYLLMEPGWESKLVLVWRCHLNTNGGNISFADLLSDKMSISHVGCTAGKEATSKQKENKTCAESQLRELIID